MKLPRVPDTRNSEDIVRTTDINETVEVLDKELIR